MVRIKRVYEPKVRGDGYRVLVDRLWPRGVKKSELQFNEWPKEVAPSPGLRQAFAHDPRKWKMFRDRYLRELRSPTARTKLLDLARKAKRSTVTLLYAARDPDFNHARILKEAVEALL